MHPPAYPEIAAMQGLDYISLAEMDEVKLLNRTDTKFVFKRSLLNEILPLLAEDYRVLNVEGNIISRYQTLYFDTDEYKFYLDHHNQKGNRFKVRMRKYVESELFFLEIKNKFKGRTDKKRIMIDDFEMDMKKKSKTFVDEVLGVELDLKSKLWNSFGRITLVNKKEKERLTLDLDLTFEWDDQKHVYDHVVIAELKQENVNRNSLFYRLMKKNGVRPTGMSKYCIGALTLEPTLKYNNFKRKKLLINKLK
ncbi:MAG: polyphosphate polymerase domain-containing protein [Flavobacteriales bacterium]|nr:polyphosphate polymerase domain-containing protein [Flavobacteriales bacterium]